MNNLIWLNQSQPQTLYSGTMLAYFRAVWLLLFQSGGRIIVEGETITSIYGLLAFDVFKQIGLGGLFGDLMWLILAAALALGGLGIANEKKWGYYAGVAGAVSAVVAVLWWMQRAEDFTSLSMLIRLMFDFVLVVLLLHPMSRSYRKIWFR